jgi:hypothetical protein
VTSSHPSSPTQGVRTVPARTPCRVSRTPGRWAGVLLVGCMVLVGCQRPAAQPEAEAAPSTRAASERETVTRPVSIAIPAAGVEARVVPVGLQPDRTMEVPEVDRAGWYELGPRPGEAGPAVIVGHVDFRAGGVLPAR